MNLGSNPVLFGGRNLSWQRSHCSGSIATPAASFGTVFDMVFMGFNAVLNIRALRLSALLLDEQVFEKIKHACFSKLQYNLDELPHSIYFFNT